MILWSLFEFFSKCPYFLFLSPTKLHQSHWTETHIYIQMLVAIEDRRCVRYCRLFLALCQIYILRLPQRQTKREWTYSLQQQYEGLAQQLSMWIITKEEKNETSWCGSLDLLCTVFFFPCSTTKNEIAYAVKSLWVYIVRLTGLSWHNEEFLGIESNADFIWYNFVVVCHRLHQHQADFFFSYCSQLFHFDIGAHLFRTIKHHTIITCELFC